MRAALKWRTVLTVTLSLFLLNCEFDSSVPSLPAGHRVVIVDVAPSGANCEQRSSQMMWIIWDYERQKYPGLPSDVESDVPTPNGDACRYSTVITAFHPEHIATVPWFVLAMDEEGWVAQCFTPLMQITTAGLVPVPTITFRRGEAGCTVGG